MSTATTVVYSYAMHDAKEDLFDTLYHAASAVRLILRSVESAPHAQQVLQMLYRMQTRMQMQPIHGQALLASAKAYQSFCDTIANDTLIVQMFILQRHLAPAVIYEQAALVVSLLPQFLEPTESAESHH